MKLALNVTAVRWLYPSGTVTKSTSIHIQVLDNEHNVKAIKTFRDVTPAQAARAVALQNKLAGRK